MNDPTRNPHAHNPKPDDRRRFRGDSIRLRLLALSALLIGAALVAGYLLISTILQEFITGRFDAEAASVSEALIAGAQVSDDGRLVAGTPPADQRFSMPLTGWYWQMEQDGRVMAKSASLFDNVLSVPAGDSSGATVAGPAGQALRLTRSSFTLPDSDSRMAVTVTIPRADIEGSLALVRKPLAISLLMLGIGLALASVIQVTAGLRSLDRLGRDLRRIRAGKSETLPLPPVAELRPIAVEINGLLDQNRSVLARSREHVGNLAHSLKTPLAALSNGLPADHPGQALIARMDRQIGWHLRRARSSAAPRLLGQRTEIGPVVDDILLVLRRPLDDAGITVRTDILPPDLAFAGDRQDLEEIIGNLTENAAKWARSRIRISASPVQAAGAAELRVVIEDDGPGMSDKDHALALARGSRLDETGPAGSGLGLAIVADLAALHGGKLVLNRSDLGGLRAEIALPA